MVLYAMLTRPEKAAKQLLVTPRVLPSVQSNDVLSDAW